MKVLIDTHILLWLFIDPEKIALFDKKVLQDKNTQIFVCPVSIFEIALKLKLGKLNLERTSLDELLDKCPLAGITIDESGITNIFAQLERYDYSFITDPFDKCILAHAKTKGYKLISYDLKVNKLLNMQTWRSLKI